MGMWRCSRSGYLHSYIHIFWFICPRGKVHVLYTRLFLFTSQSGTTAGSPKLRQLLHCAWSLHKALFRGVGELNGGANSGLERAGRLDGVRGEGGATRRGSTGKEVGLLLVWAREESQNRASIRPPTCPLVPPPKSRDRHSDHCGCSMKQDKFQLSPENRKHSLFYLIFRVHTWPDVFSRERYRSVCQVSTVHFSSRNIPTSLILSVKLSQHHEGGGKTYLKLASSFEIKPIPSPRTAALANQASSVMIRYDRYDNRAGGL